MANAQLCQLLDLLPKETIATVPDFGFFSFAMKKIFFLSLVILSLSQTSCDDTGYDHYYTEYLVSSNDSVVVQYLDENESWVLDSTAKGVYYEFNRSPRQPLELKVKGLKFNQRITAVIRAERKRLSYQDVEGDTLYIELKVEDYPNF